MKSISGGDQWCANQGQNQWDYPGGCCEGKACSPMYGVAPICVPFKQVCHVDPT